MWSLMFKIAKGAITFVSAIGGALIVESLVKVATPRNMVAIGKLCMFFGGVAASCLVADKLAVYTDQTIDGVGNAVNSWIAAKPKPDLEVVEEA